MAWREILDAAYARGREGARPRYGPPVGADVLARAERALSCALPGELRDFLLEANGVMELINIDGRWIESMWIMWTAEELCDRNIELRRQRDEGRFPAGALAFADAGTDGVVFAFDLQTPNFEVFAWHPITAECEVKARSLREFLPGWITGGISV
jgi:hypothetical protein